MADEFKRQLSELETALGKGLAGLNFLGESTAQDVVDLKREISEIKQKVHTMEISAEVTRSRVDDLRDGSREGSQKLRALEIQDARDVPATERYKASAGMKAAVLASFLTGVLGLATTLAQLLAGNR